MPSIIRWLFFPDPTTKVAATQTKPACAGFKKSEREVAATQTKPACAGFKKSEREGRLEAERRAKILEERLRSLGVDPDSLI